MHDNRRYVKLNHETPLLEPNQLLGNLLLRLGSHGHPPSSSSPPRGHPSTGAGTPRSCRLPRHRAVTDCVPGAPRTIEPCRTGGDVHDRLRQHLSPSLPGSTAASSTSWNADGSGDRSLTRNAVRFVIPFARSPALPKRP